MKRSEKIFDLIDIEGFNKQLLKWSQTFQEIVFLDSNTTSNHHDKYSQFDYLLAVDGFTSIKTDTQNGFDKLNEFQKHNQDWLFGFLSFDLKEDTHQIASQQINFLGFPDLYFFQPKKLIIVKNKQAHFLYLPLFDDEIDVDFEAINSLNHNFETIEKREVDFQLRTPKTDYLKSASQLLKEIQLGNIYEVNYCVEFYKDHFEINPVSTFNKLNQLAKSPFAAFVSIHDFYVMSASPERYLLRRENKVVSQPIKGTAQRFENVEADEKSKNDLKSNAKEISENVMIVDLVRNDLSITAKKNTVKVEELCEIYTFNQVHQMISTVVSEVEDEISSVELLKTTFPMGSMTGAPKHSALKLIDKYENFKRGIYSGAIGYFDPKGNFDFNVVIRTLLYNAQTKYLSYSAGSALTSQANAAHEYEECLLKAQILSKLFNT